MKKLMFLLLPIFGYLLPSPVAAAPLMCACCADEGEYVINSVKPSDYVLSQLKELRFDGSAKVFTGEADVADVVRGIADPLDDYLLAGLFEKNSFRLDFRTADNKTGTLALPLPAKMLDYKVDTREPRAEGEMVKLYKEWRFAGAATSGTGFFKPGFAAPANYFLILQGRGNRCDNASDFTHWRLEISGRRAGYAFYGTLGEPVQAAQNRINVFAPPDALSLQLDSSPRKSVLVELQ